MSTKFQERNSLQNKEYPHGSSIHGNIILYLINVLLPDILVIFSFSV